MNLSLGEYRALAAKAFRGVGYSWGLTEDAGFAAKRLAEFDLPSGEVVVRLLHAIDGLPLRQLMPRTDSWDHGSILCPICVGTTIADQGGCGDAQISQVLEPLLVAPFLIMTLDSESSTGYTIMWDGGQCQLTSHGVRLDGAVPTGAVDIRVSPADLGLTDPKFETRIDLAAETLVELERFASRIYAPATEASRSAGAGDGS